MDAMPGTSYGWKDAMPETSLGWNDGLQGTSPGWAVGTSLGWNDGLQGTSPGWPDGTSPAGWMDAWAPGMTAGRMPMKHSAGKSLLYSHSSSAGNRQTVAHGNQSHFHILDVYKDSECMQFTTRIHILEWSIVLQEPCASLIVTTCVGCWTYTVTSH